MKTPNKSIGCIVDNCEFHCKTQNYCSLNEIKVGKCNNNPQNVNETDCDSFKTSNY